MLGFPPPGVIMYQAFCYSEDNDTNPLNYTVVSTQSGAACVSVRRHCVKVEQEALNHIVLQQTEPRMVKYKTGVLLNNTGVFPNKSDNIGYSGAKKRVLCCIYYPRTKRQAEGRAHRDRTSPTRTAQRERAVHAVAHIRVYVLNLCARKRAGVQHLRVCPIRVRLVPRCARHWVG